MLRRLAKHGLAVTLQGSGLLRAALALRGRRRTPLVVGYHRVAERLEGVGTALPGMLITLRTLERQLDWLARRFRLLALPELGERLAAGEAFERPVAAVTFDDGYADFYELAFPLLRRKGVPAAVFVVTDVVSGGRLQIYDRLHILLERAAARGLCGATLARRCAALGLHPPTPLPERPYAALRALLGAWPQDGLGRLARALEQDGPLEARDFPELRPLDWEQVRALHRSGVTIGSHTRSHALLAREEPARARAEAAESRSELERRLGAPVRHFAFPDGSFDGAALQAVEAAGYGWAYTTCQHRAPGREHLTIPRRLLFEGSCLDGRGRFSGAVMGCQAAGVFDRLAPCAQAH